MTGQETDSKKAPLEVAREAPADDRSTARPDPAAVAGAGDAAVER